MTHIIKLEKWNPQNDGALNEGNMRKKLEALGYQVNCYVYPPDTCFPEHSHSVDKIDGVLSGRFQMCMHDQTLVLEAGDCLWVPKGVAHSAEVLGDQAVVSLDAVRRN
ncbi:MAG: cupin domain-containing protein [Gammaproteobacteria bacterium]|nr:cupin domain-containing protein [Gammaproteobacteria bacterium]